MLSQCFLLGRFSFVLSKSFERLKVPKSNLICDYFSSSIPRGNFPSGLKFFIFRISSELSRRLLSITFIFPMELIFYLSNILRLSFSCATSVSASATFAPSPGWISFSSSFNSAREQFFKILNSMLVTFSAKKGNDQLNRFKLSGSR